MENNSIIRSQDEVYMKHALSLAENARGRTNPNPMVGAVIVKDGKIVGEGWHHKAGTPHAEVHALRMAGDFAKGATLYVTLEPCSHYGKTPPCADAVVAAGLKRVVIAIEDPNPKVAGRGVSKLRDAGIDVTLGVCAEEALRLNEVFLKHIQTNLPYILVKTAMTLDGKIATRTGKSKWISNEKSRRYVHLLRDEYDAILTGIGSVLKDDPMLNVRLEDIEAHQPVRIILDRNLRIPLTSRIVKTANVQPTIIVCGPDIPTKNIPLLEAEGVEIMTVPEKQPGMLDLEFVLRKLKEEKEICSVLIEGGAEVYASFFKEGLVDKVCWFIAPKIFGGKEAPGPIGGTGVDNVDEAIILKNMNFIRFDEDICIEAYPEK